MEESLFLEEEATGSRLDAYELDVVNCLDGAGRIVASDVAATPDFRSIQVMKMLPLKSRNEIVDYDTKTHRFRAYFIDQRFSYAVLSITNSLFRDMLSALNVGLRIHDYVLYFGEREREVEIVPPRLKYRILQEHRTMENTGHECMYGLRFLENNGRRTPEELASQWSMRQSAIYSRYEYGSRGTTWVFVALSKQAKRRLDEYVAQAVDLQNADPLDVHLLLLDTALSSWRQYLVDLATEVDEHTAQISGMSPDDQGPISLSDAARRQDLMLLDNKLLDALLIAQSQKDTVHTLRRSVNTTPESLHPIKAFAQHILCEQAFDLDLYILQLESLRTKLYGSSSLLSSFLDLGNGHALQNLARESRQENEGMRKLSERMHELTKKATRDAAAVKVLTIMTLIYLPATVVSNFFSTSFVTTEGPPNHIAVSNDWWIFMAVSVPLTVLTLYVWYAWKEHQADGKYPPWWKIFQGRRRRQDMPAADQDRTLANKV